MWAIDTLKWHPARYLDRRRWGKLIWQEYKTYKLASGIKEKTLAQYERDCIAFGDWAKANYGYRLYPDRPMFERYLAYLTTTIAQGSNGGGRMLSARRIRNILTALKSFYRYVEARGLRDNPVKDIPFPKAGTKVIEIYDPWERTAVLDWLKNRYGYPREKILRDDLIFRIFFATGVRESELVSLEPIDVDINDRQLTIRHAKLNKERVVPIPADIARNLEFYMRQRDWSQSKKVFPITGARVWNIWKKGCFATGVSPRGIHCMRHTWACDILMGDPEKGITPIQHLDLMYLGGWSDLKMVDHYSAAVAKQVAIRNYHESGR
jgi:integrase